MNIPKAWSIAVATMAGGACLFVSDKFWIKTGPAHFTTQAEAIIGRPLTPFSVAGVARRTTRRAVAAGYYGYGYRSYGYGYPSNYGYTNYGSSYPSNYGYASYGSSYPSNYGYASYGTSYPSNYGYANYGTSYPSNYGYANYGTSYPYNYGYSNYGTSYPNNYGYTFPIPTSKYNPQRRQVQRNKEGDLE